MQNIFYNFLFIFSFHKTFHTYIHNFQRFFRKYMNFAHLYVNALVFLHIFYFYNIHNIYSVGAANCSPTKEREKNNFLRISYKFVPDQQCIADVACGVNVITTTCVLHHSNLRIDSSNQEIFFHLSYLRRTRVNSYYAH